jgi:hypothetical protein
VQLQSLRFKNPRHAETEADPAYNTFHMETYVGQQNDAVEHTSGELSWKHLYTTVLLTLRNTGSRHKRASALFLTMQQSL